GLAHRRGDRAAALHDEKRVDGVKRPRRAAAAVADRPRRPLDRPVVPALRGRRVVGGGGVGRRGGALCRPFFLLGDNTWTDKAQKMPLETLEATQQGCRRPAAAPSAATADDIRERVERGELARFGGAARRQAAAPRVVGAIGRTRRRRRRAKAPRRSLGG